VRAVRAEYSLDGGGTWREAKPAAGTLTTSLATSPAGEPHSFGWATFASGFFGKSDNVAFRIVALPGLSTPSGQVAGPFMRPYAAATSFPFRARGTQVQVVDATDAPRPDAIVLRRASGDTGASSLFASPGGAPLTTDARGFLRGRGTLALSDTLVALLPVKIAATNPYSDSYTLYHTNIIPNAEGVSGLTVIGPGVQRIVASAEHPLALFHLDVALEWDARYDQRFMAQLEYDLRRASEFLFDATNGQAALGDVNLWHDRENWDSAHIRIYASNRVRPSAIIGGVASAVFTRTVSLANGQNTLFYGPGQVRMGAVWSRFGNQSGSSLGEDWPRTLAHELGHYLLFLDDNYLGYSSAARREVIPIDGCGGLMGDPYISLELRGPANWNEQCQRTFSHATYGRSDWETLQSFYPALNSWSKTPADALAGPATLPLAVTSIISNEPLTPTARLSVPIFYTTEERGNPYLPSPEATAFLFQDSPNDSDSDFDRITNLGRANIDQVLARGARVGDRICLFDPRSQRQSCETIKAGDETIALRPPLTSQPDLTVTPVNSRTLQLQLRTTPALTVSQSVVVELYPADTQKPPAPATLSPLPGASGVYSGQLQLDSAVLDGYLHVTLQPADIELVTGFSLSGDTGPLRSAGGQLRAGGGQLRAGGGQLRAGGGQLRAGGGQLRAGGAPVSSAEGDVLLVDDTLTFTASQLLLLQAVAVPPQPPPWAAPLGQAYRLATSGSPPLDLTSSAVSFSYRGAEVPVEEEQGIRVYFYAENGWEQLETTLDTYHNIVSAPSRGAGIYVLMSSRLLPPLTAGWNLLSYPGASRPVRDALAAIDGKYTTVYGYEPARTTDPWKIYAAGLPAEWQEIVNDLDVLAPDGVYWLRATEAITTPLVSGARSRQLAATPAQSLTLPPATYYGLVAGAPGAGPVTLEARVDGRLCGQAVAQAATIGGKSELAFAIDVRAAGAGADAGCGTPGREVRFAMIQAGRVFARLEATWSNDFVQAIEAAERRIFLPLLGR
jgi:hypothetical protein